MKLNIGIARVGITCWWYQVEDEHVLVKPIQKQLMHSSCRHPEWKYWVCIGRNAGRWRDPVSGWIKILLAHLFVKRRKFYTDTYKTRLAWYVRFRNCVYEKLRRKWNKHLRISLAHCPAMRKTKAPKRETTPTIAVVVQLRIGGSVGKETNLSSPQTPGQQGLSFVMCPFKFACWSQKNYNPHLIKEGVYLFIEDAKVPPQCRSISHECYYVSQKILVNTRVQLECRTEDSLSSSNSNTWWHKKNQ